MRTICSVIGCLRLTEKRDLCGTHYQRLRKHGTTDEPPNRGHSREQLLANGFIKAKCMSKCHPDMPHAARGLCENCYHIEWRKENPDKVRKYNKATMQRNPTKARVSRFKAALKSAYGMSIELYDSMLLAQKYKCANPRCPTQFEMYLDMYTDRRRTIQVDHCHFTGKIRGLLCKGCNASLGHIQDDKERLRGLVEYLEANG